MIREQIKEATKFLHSTEVILFDIATFCMSFLFVYRNLSTQQNYG